MLKFLLTTEPLVNLVSYRICRERERERERARWLTAVVGFVDSVAAVVISITVD